MQAIGLLASGVAHNFNNLLMVVLGSLELARRKESGSNDESRLISNAMVAAKKCADIARHLLAFGRSQPLRPKTANLMALLQTVCEMLHDALPDNIHVVLDAQECLPQISIDPTEFELALLNLAMNAKDAMPHGGRLDIRAFMQTKERDNRFDANYLVVEVADNGVGIPSEQLPKVFDPFFTTKEVGNGTGLGLSQVHGFVHQSGGAVEIESTVGRGTCVRIYLPKKKLQQG
jgi:signal transduction histidine kinase